MYFNQSYVINKWQNQNFDPCLSASKIRSIPIVERLQKIQLLYFVVYLTMVNNL